MHPETRAVHPELAAWAEKQSAEVRGAVEQFLYALWLVKANPPNQNNLDMLAQYAKALADAKAKTAN